MAVSVTITAGYLFSQNEEWSERDTPRIQAGKLQPSDGNEVVSRKIRTERRVNRLD